jgi:hypothetical protein
MRDTIVIREIHAGICNVTQERLAEGGAGVLVFQHDQDNVLGLRDVKLPLR